MNFRLHIVALSKFESGLIFLVPIILLIGSINLTTSGNFLPATSVLEVAFLTAAVLLALRSRWPRGKLFWLSVIYVLVHSALALVFSVAPFDEVVRAHKWLLFLVALQFFIGKQTQRPNQILTLTKTLIIAMVLKYAAVIALFGASSRPALFTENNFELALVIGLTTVSIKKFENKYFFWVVLLASAVLMSGSRSAAIGFVALIVYIAVTTESRNVVLKYFWTISCLIAFLLPVLVFQSRSTSLETLDRLNFFNLFQLEISHWQFLDWILGAPSLTQLSSYTCQSLSYYESLFSSANDGTCYSVIWHSFVLRLVFDFGIFGILLAVIGFYLTLRKAGVSWVLAVTLLALSLINGFSVSGLNNIYVVLPFVYAITTSSNPERPSEGDAQ